mmetsp:Transcript_40785/g.46753  ORF Transcript_40785/g.46753 Transcript_40785/m.46753 type:complete len:131 (+) Transcript_40785:467-859(+)
MRKFKSTFKEIEDLKNKLNEKERETYELKSQLERVESKKHASELDPNESKLDTDLHIHNIKWKSNKFIELNEFKPMKLSPNRKMSESRRLNEVVPNNFLKPPKPSGFKHSSEKRIEQEFDTNDTTYLCAK